METTKIGFRSPEAADILKIFTRWSMTTAVMTTGNGGETYGGRESDESLSDQFWSLSSGAGKAA